jgi:hypothetical protein
MAITLAESAYLSQNKLQKGIIEELLYTSPLMGKLPFVTVSGNALAINREDSDNLGSADFYAVDGTWVETSAAFSQATYSLTTLGGDVDVNNLIRQSRSNINDQMAAQVKVKTKKMTHTFEDQMIYSTSGQGFSGLHSLTDSAMHVHQGSGSTGAALSLKNLDKAVDMVSVLGTPSFILLNKTLNRQISSYLRTVGSYTTERDDYGHYFTMWQGIPIITTDWIGQVEAGQRILGQDWRLLLVYLRRPNGRRRGAGGHPERRNPDSGLGLARDQGRLKDAHQVVRGHGPVLNQGHRPHRRHHRRDRYGIRRNHGFC